MHNDQVSCSLPQGGKSSLSNARYSRSYGQYEGSCTHSRVYGDHGSSTSGGGRLTAEEKEKAEDSNQELKCNAYLSLASQLVITIPGEEPAP